MGTWKSTKYPNILIRVPYKKYKYLSGTFFALKIDKNIEYRNKCIKDLSADL